MYYITTNDDGIIQAWYDLDVPPTTPGFIQVSDEDYDHWHALPCRIDDTGKIVAYTPPPLPLKEQAQSVLASLQSQASWLTVRGKTFGPLTNHYVDILESIIDGTNVTCTILPEKPADLTQ